MSKFDRLVAGVQPHLEAGEQVEAAVQGNYETKIMGNDSIRAGVLLATNRRVVFYAKKLGGYDLESFPYPNISSIEMSKGMTGSRIAFFATGNKVAMKHIRDAKALDSFVELLRARQHQTPSPTADSPEVPSAPPQAADVMEQIRKLGELKEAGIITEEEFSTKKTELLGRL